MADYWIKLYLDLLDDPKVGMLPEYLQLRMIKLFLVAKEFNQDGLLPPVSHLAWRLRTDEGSIRDTLAALGLIGVVRETDPEIWLVTNFKKRQAAVTSTERVRQFRKREGNETFREMKRDETFSSASASVSSSVSNSLTGSDVSQFNNGWERQAYSLYQHVTSQMSIPSLTQTQALADLQTILDHYGNNFERAVEEGKEVFGVWCNTLGKNGKPYTKTNTAWLGKWLEKIAPVPGDPHETSMQAILKRMRKEQEALQP